MKEQLQSITKKLTPMLAFSKRYLGFGFCILLLALYALLVFRIKTFVLTEPSDDAVDEKIQTVQRPRVDPGTLQKIQELQDQHIQVQSLFKDARNNPFQE